MSCADSRNAISSLMAVTTRHLTDSPNDPEKTTVSSAMCPDFLGIRGSEGTPRGRRLSRNHRYVAVPEFPVGLEHPLLVEALYGAAPVCCSNFQTFRRIA